MKIEIWLSAEGSIETPFTMRGILSKEEEKYFLTLNQSEKREYLKEYIFEHLEIGFQEID